MKTEIDPKMPEKLKVILQSLQADMDNLDYVIHYMNNYELWDEENDLSRLKGFLKDTVEEYRLEIPYHKKWSGIVYDENVYKHREFASNLFEQILVKLELT